MTLGSRIRSARKLLGLPQQAVADQLSVSTQAISQWENDRTEPSLENLVNLAAVLSTNTDWLTGSAQGSVETQVQIPTDEEHERLTFGRRIPVIRLQQAFYYIRQTPGNDFANRGANLGIDYHKLVSRTLESTTYSDGERFCVISDKDDAFTGLNFGDYAIFENLSRIVKGDVVLGAIFTDAGITTRYGRAMDTGAVGEAQVDFRLPKTEPEGNPGLFQIVYVATLIEVRRIRGDDRPIFLSSVA